MPIYEYQCSKCNRVTEKLQGFSDPPLKTCPHCRGRVRKLVSNSSFVLKGGGWYRDGYSSTGGNGSGASGDNGKTAGGGNEKKAADGAKSTAKKTAKAAA